MSTLEWVGDIVRYSVVGELLTTKEEAKKVKNKATRFTMIDDMLYRWGSLTPLLRCVSKEEANYIMGEIHTTVCGNHSGGRALAAKILRARYYWPHPLRDAREFTQRCTQC